MPANISIFYTYIFPSNLKSICLNDILIIIAILNSYFSLPKWQDLAHQTFEKLLKNINSLYNIGKMATLDISKAIFD